MLQAVNVGAVTVGLGWSVAVERTSAGQWNWGYANSPYATAVTLSQSITDTAHITGTYAGMRWFSPTTDGEKVGFDNFKVSALEIFESWATQADLDPSTGAGYLMWTGDIASFELTTESWPTSFDHDRARLLRSPPLEALRHCSLPTAPRSPTLKLVP